MFPSGQWSFNPLAYQNVPSDRVDWASLAQQWIKMKETMPILAQEPTPPPAPQISKPKSTRSDSTDLPANDIEGGEAPMDMDTKDDDVPESVGASSNYNMWNNWPNQWGWGWSGNAGTVPSAENASSTSSSVDSKTKWSENVFPTDTAKSTSETWSKGNRPRQSQKPFVIEQTPVIDAVKKKQLPAWIREGLNKMEREKQKKIEHERLMQQRLMRKQESFREDSPEENFPIIASNPTYVPDPSQNAATIPSDVHSFEPSTISVPDPPCLNSPPRNREENTSLIRKTKDEIMEESMLKIRRILTEILLEATENHVLMIAREELKRAKSSARAIRRSNTLSALTGNLGLNIYGSGSDDSDSSGSDNIHFDRKSDSDEELKLLIDRKKYDFRKVEDEIEIEIEKQEAKEKSIARQDEEEDDDDDDDRVSDVDDTKSNSGSASRLQEVPRQDARSKPSSSKEEDSPVTSNKSKELRVPSQEPSGSGGANRSSSQLNGDRKNGKVESKHTRSPSSSSSSDSTSESSSSKSSRSKSSYSSTSGSDSDTSSRKKRSKRSKKTNKRSKATEKPKRHRSRSRSPSRDRRSTHSRAHSSRSYKSESHGRRPSPYRRRSRSRQRSSSRGREKYSESRRYDSHRRRRSNSADSRRSRYKRR